MAIIRIVKDNLELDFVKETLTIRKENNALIRNFKVSHSNFPFLVVENKTTKQILGPREITSVNKKRVVTVDVYENDLKYYGELTIKEYLNGYRKCDLKYASPLLEIMNKKIAEFMPVISVVTGLPTSNDYIEESINPITGDSSWPDYVENIITQGFPNVKWNFPMMYWKDKFGADLESTDEWFAYKDFVNFFDDAGNYLLNTVVEEDLNFTITNVQVPMPQVYIQTPLFYALESIGFTSEGDFLNNSFIKKIMMLSFKNNLCKFYPSLPPEEISFGPLNFEGLGYFKAVFNLTTASVGTYLIRYRFTEPLYTGSGPVTSKTFKVSFDGATDGYTHVRSATGKIYEAAVEINVKESQLGLPIKFSYLTPQNTMPDYEITIELKSEKASYKLHPTIDFSRYVPDWTFGTYLNNIKNWFNLDVDIDDLRNKLVINLNEEWFLNQVPVQLQKNLQIISYQQTPYEAFLLKHENDEDTALWITRESVEVYTNQNQVNAQTLDGKFKDIPILFETASLSDEIENKNGVGLIIYNHQLGPKTAASFDGKTLKIDGEGGIYDVFWKKFLKFRINASVIELTGGFTKTEIGQILKAKRIYNHHQDYAVALLEYKELKQDNYLVTFKVESVNL